MPTYLIRNKITGESFEKKMSISESEEFLKNNPDLEKAPVLFANGGVQDTKLKKPDDGFREVMSKIAESHVVDRNSKRNLTGF